jgi:phosphatidylglycerophosphate synthase
MITVKDIEEKSMTPQKKAMAKNDLFAFYIGRPLSYVLTIPFLYTNISPNTISIISIVPAVFGFLAACAARTKAGMIASWLMFFLWNLLDGVDGNVARYKKQFSKLGSVYDAMAGYIASALMFFAAGIMAAHSKGPLIDRGLIGAEALIICGGLIAIVDLLPRLVMHKAVTTMMDKEAVKDVMDKADYGLVKTIALNLRSCAGGAQLLLLVAILLNILDLYTVCYLLFNTAVMIMSLRSVLKEDK